MVYYPASADFFLQLQCFGNQFLHYFAMNIMMSRSSLFIQTCIPYAYRSGIRETSFLFRIRSRRLFNSSANSSGKWTSSTAAEKMKKKLEEDLKSTGDLKAKDEVVEKTQKPNDSIWLKLWGSLKDTQPKQSDIPSIPEEDWKTIYKFHYILVARNIQKLKKYQTFFTTGMTGYTIFCALAGHTETLTLLVTSLTSAFTVWMLFVVGNICQRLVGFAYVSKDAKYVKFAHLSFWGKRHETVVPVKDFLPLSFTEKQDLYIKLYYTGRGSGKYFYLCPAYSDIFDKELFVKVFGDVTFPDPEKQKHILQAILNQKKIVRKKPE